MHPLFLAVVIVLTAPAVAVPSFHTTSLPRYEAWYSSAGTLSAPRLLLTATQESQPAASSPASAPATEPAAPVTAEEALGDEEEEDSKPPWLRPFSFDMTYSLYSDYVWRGINLSEYETEGSEAPNHQLTTTLDVDLGKFFNRKADGEFGVFSFEAFFEWYAHQVDIDPVYGARNLQEVDYTLTYAYEVKPIFTTFSTGVIFYTYPKHKEIATEEWFFRVEHNDAWMWKWLWPENEDGIVNPYVAYWQDTHLVAPGSWIQFGFSHDFEVTPSFTLTPAIDFGIEHNWLQPTLGLEGKGTNFANVQYGLTLEYDLTELIALDKWGYGSVVLSGFLFYSDAVGNPAQNDWLNDELYGGMSVGWSF
ncbi:MAG: hypothetical protein IT450_05765 [Phycisphaerales bacterium]|nr:hypothetical protein [Phycisphaerales bacterium]